MGILLYPNLNDGKFRLRFENGKQEKYQIQIINELGQIQLEKETYLIGSSYEEEFELSHLPKEIYFIKVSDGNEFKTKQVILR